MTSSDRRPTSPRKQATEALLRGLGIPINPWLPMISEEPEARLRPAEEVAARAVILYVVSSAAQDDYRPIAIEVLRSTGLWDRVSPNEEAFLSTAKPSEGAKISAAWCAEAAWTLFWAIGKIRELSLPSAHFDVALLDQLAPSREDIRRVCADATLRPLNEILDETDKIYRIHWAVRDLHLKGSKPPANFSPCVVRERHRALNWVTCYHDEWDEVTTDT